MNEIVKIEKCQITKTGLKFNEKLSFEEWQEVGKQLQKIHGSIQWWIGDWLNFGERKYGEMYTQAIEETGLDYSTLTTYKSVSGVFESCPRGQNLSWSAHRELASAPEGKRVELLERANEEKMTSREVKEIVRVLKKLPTPELPKGKYNVLYIDPPWQYDNSGISGAAANHYSTLSIEELCNLKVKELSADNSVLFMWVTNPQLDESFKIVEDWGFKYKTNIVWTKDKAGQGFYVKGQHELLLICVKGNFTPDNSLYIRSVVNLPRQEHSKKPDKFYEIIEELYPKGKYLELFARNKRKGWESWGNEI